MGSIDLDNLINRAETSGQVTKGEAQAIRYEVTMLRQQLEAALAKLPVDRPEAVKFYAWDTEVTFDEDVNGNEIEVTALVGRTLSEGSTLNEAVYNQPGFGSRQGGRTGFVYAVWENENPLATGKSPDYMVVLTAQDDVLRIGLDQFPPVYF